MHAYYKRHRPHTNRSLTLTLALTLTPTPTPTPTPTSTPTPNPKPNQVMARVGASCSARREATRSTEIAPSSMEMGEHGGAYGPSSLEGEEGADADELAT